MQINTFILHKDCTRFPQNYQLVLPLDIEHLIPDDDSVRLLSQFIERMFLGDLYRTYCREGHANEPTPRQLLKILVYGYMNHLYSSREIAAACVRDINFMWLLEGAKAPHYSTIARFRTLHFGLCAEPIMAEMSQFLYQLGELSRETIFIDGTKIEACANKYTFVWKKAVSKNPGPQPADTYTCHNGKKLHKESIKGNHCKTPLEDRNKNLYVSKKLLEYREADLERIESEEGIKLRMNRNIQVERSFGELKQNSGFRRFLCRESQKVKAEAILLAFAHNINKLHHKIQGDRTGNHLFPLKKSA